ncbi:OmpW/AlkL family protein [Dyella sp.]|uniref:OmpW/AlkL family protein n=1 Tax=Dyella sp. TaxID=1869338 RepID=UPI002ED3FC9B
MKITRITTLFAGVIAACMVAAPVVHADDGNWVLRFGAHVVDPKSDNGRLAGMKASVDSSTRPSASLEYMFTPNWGVDVLAAWPFRHDVRLNGVRAASTQQLPPTVGVNYHFMPDAKVSPFVGAGLNYTWFHNTHGRGPLQGASVSIENSWGAAAHAGVDVKLSDRWLFTADLRWIDIRSDVHVNGAKVGRATINPLVYGVSLGYRF